VILAHVSKLDPSITRLSLPSYGPDARKRWHTGGVELRLSGGGWEDLARTSPGASARGICWQAKSKADNRVPAAQKPDSFPAKTPCISLGSGSDGCALRSRGVGWWIHVLHRADHAGSLETPARLSFCSRDLAWRAFPRRVILLPSHLTQHQHSTNMTCQRMHQRDHFGCTRRIASGPHLPMIPG
jgi:hypothetical protein